MRKSRLWKVLTALSMLIGLSIVSNSPKVVEAAETLAVTYTFTNKDWNATDSTGKNANWTNDQSAYGKTDQGVQVTATYSGANATSKESFTNISKVVVVYSTNASKGKGSIAISAGDKTEEKTIDSTGTADRTFEWTYAKPFVTGNVKIAVECNENSIYIKSVAIYTEPVVTKPDDEIAADNLETVKTKIREVSNLYDAQNDVVPTINFPAPSIFPETTLVDYTSSLPNFFDVDDDTGVINFKYATGDNTVNLTIYIIVEYNEEEVEDQISIQFTIKKASALFAERVAATKSALQASFNSFNGKTDVKELPKLTTSNAADSTTIAWTSNNDNVVVASDGSVVITPAGKTDTLACTLTAKISSIIDGSEYVDETYSLSFDIIEETTVAAEALNQIPTMASIGFGYSVAEGVKTTKTTTFSSVLSGSATEEVKNAGSVTKFMSADDSKIFSMTAYRNDSGTGDNSNAAYVNSSELRIYAGAGNGSAVEIKGESVLITKVEISYSYSGTYTGASVLADGATVTLSNDNGFDVFSISNGTDKFTIQNKTTAQVRMTEIKITYTIEDISYDFSNIKLRFAATIPADIYETLNPTAFGIEVNRVGGSADEMVDINNAALVTQENGDRFFAGVIEGIPLNKAALTTKLVAKAYIVVNDQRIYLEEKTHSVETIVDAYIANYVSLQIDAEFLPVLKGLKAFIANAPVE